ncbi:MAG: 2-amino-3,7-dideoxy-D-threo-hept-6-ulosonate synthase [Candidatus Bathyarchaeia archaeon]
MQAGKRRRLSRIFQSDWRTVIVPMDHGVTLGPVKGLADMPGIVAKLREGRCDAVVVHKGIARHVDTQGLGLIVHLSASTSCGPDPTRKVEVGQVEEAIALGADAVSVHINVGADNEPEMLRHLGGIAGECEAWGIPLLAMMYPRGPRIKSEHDVRFVAHAARLGAELGADIVKTNYTGSVETFKEVVAACPVPVIIAGGPRASTDLEVLEMVQASLEAGGRGVSIGRNVFQHENPTRMAQAIVGIVHQGLTAKEAYAKLQG